MRHRVQKTVYGITTTYLRDASGNVMCTYEGEVAQEWTICGSSRLGVYRGGREVGQRKTGLKNYELSNHLGNVLAVISDKKILSGSVFTADVVSASDYYPFGLAMPKREYQSSGYRYGFNGQEKTPEVAAGQTTAEFWQYDSKIARRWNVDPVDDESESSYTANKNNPIKNSDPKGDCPGVCPEGDNLVAKVSVGITLGKTNKNISFGFNVAYSVQTESGFSSEFTLGIMATRFSRVNNFKSNGISTTMTGSALFGSGGNTDMAGSGILSPLGMYSSEGSSGFNGGGIGFTRISLKGDKKVHKLSNISWNALGRFSIGKGSLSVNIMEDYPWTDHGSTGGFSLNYTLGLGDDQALSVGFSNETYTDVGAGRRKSEENNLSTNETIGYFYYGKKVTGAPDYGTNSINFSFINNNLNINSRLGLYGGKSGAAFQNFFHKYPVKTPLFQHDISYFGRPFVEVSTFGSHSNE